MTKTNILSSINIQSLLFALAIVPILILLDQWTKEIAINFFKIFDQDKAFKVNSFFNIVLVWNKGISFGLFNNVLYGSYIFLTVSIIITLVLLFWLATTKKFVTYLSLSFVIGGALSNCIDRLKYGAVADFLEFHFHQYFWPAFNLADSFICIGVLILLILSLLEEVKDRKNAR